MSFWEFENKQILNQSNTKAAIITEKYYEQILKALNDQQYQIFHQKVDFNSYPEYYEFIPVLIDLSLIAERLINHYYSTEDSFIFDIDMIIKNSIVFNGDQHEITSLAKKLKLEILKLPVEKDKKLLNKKRNPSPNKRVTRNTYK